MPQATDILGQAYRETGGQGGGGTHIEGGETPLLKLLPPSPLGEGGQGDRVSEQNVTNACRSLRTYVLL